MIFYIIYIILYYCIILSNEYIILQCTLHFMLSSSIEIFERGDEGTVCRYADNAYRYARSVDNNYSINTNFNIPDEVETLTPEQM